MGPMGKFSCWRGLSSNGYNVTILVELSGLLRGTVSVPCCQLTSALLSGVAGDPFFFCNHNGVIASTQRVASA